MKNPEKLFLKFGDELRRREAILAEASALVNEIAQNMGLFPTPSIPSEVTDSIKPTPQSSSAPSLEDAETIKARIIALHEENR